LCPGGFHKFSHEIHSDAKPDGSLFFGVILWCSLLSEYLAGGGYQIFVSNERSGDVTVIDGADFKAVAIIPVGKRPRGIHASPDGRTVYVAVSGTPIKPPPKLDANGNPIFEKGHDDDDSSAKSDMTADGIVVVDVAQEKLLRKLASGSDCEYRNRPPFGMHRTSHHHCSLDGPQTPMGSREGNFHWRRRDRGELPCRPRNAEAL